MSDLAVKFTFHHTGMAVESIAEALEQYVPLFGQDSVSEIFHVASQNVNVCFVKNGTDSFLELVEPSSDDSSIHKLLKKRISFYHLAYLVDDIEQAVLFLETQHYKPMEYFASEAFQGRNCVFLYAPDASLIELIEA